jgi:hypothetical protein
LLTLSTLAAGRAVENVHHLLTGWLSLNAKKGRSFFLCVANDADVGISFSKQGVN